MPTPEPDPVDPETAWPRFTQIEALMQPVDHHDPTGQAERTGRPRPLRPRTRRKP